MTSAATKKVKPESPWDIYELAQQEHESKSKMKRREACEKAWLAVVKAIDAILDRNDLHVDTGSRDAFSERRIKLGTLAIMISNGKRIVRLYSEISDYLHGACFYEGKETDYINTVFNDEVQELLELIC